MNTIKNNLRKLYHCFSPLPRIIIDNQKRLGNFKINNVSYRTDIVKEELSRKYILNFKGKNLKFMDIGGNDGKLKYLLGIKRNLNFNEQLYEKNKRIFNQKYSYSTLDIIENDNKKTIIGDICDENLLTKNVELINSFDIIYSNNVFEHLLKPWIAAKNITNMVKKGGLIITIAPFSIRYHQSPGDYFRYTHVGLNSLFEKSGEIVILESGYDIIGRRNDWQGSGTTKDICPVDKFGAWRENWFVISIAQKIQ